MRHPEYYRLIWSVTKNLHRLQAKAIIAVIIGLADCGHMRTFDIAHALADRFRIHFKSAVNRFYRLIHNRKVDDLAVWGPLAERVLMAMGKLKVISIDWTEWHLGHRVLTASVCAGRRALPIYAQTFSKTNIPRSQNTRENTFLQVLGLLTPLVKTAVLLFDRGFRRASLIKLLLTHEFLFIIRLAVKVRVVGAAYTGLLSDFPLKPGQIVDLGQCRYRSDGVVTVRIIGVWAVGQKEPWWLATCLEKSPRKVAELYDRRMSIEEQFRDTKGCRFGIRMEWTKFKTCESINRMFLLAAISLIAWMAAGEWAVREDPTMRLTSKSKGPRRSLVSIGIEAKCYIMNVLRLSWKMVFDLLPSTEIRSFAWMEKT